MTDIVRDYHWRAGVVYSRLENGDVELRLTRLLHIPASEWESVVAAMSVEGENAETYGLVKQLHERGAKPNAK